VAEKVRVLVVDDELTIRNLLAEMLRIAGFDPEIKESGSAALAAIRSNSFDVALFDVNMPGMNGFQLLEEVRKFDVQIPVIFLSARNEKVDVIEGLRIGADDYISKPFNVEEVIMRINTVLKRTKNNDQKTELIAGPVRLSEETYEVFFNDELIDLSKTEFRLLQYLLQNQGRVVTKERLLDEIWGYSFNTTTTVVDTYISYLRKKLHKDGFDGIKTIRGIGFQIKAK
jgi:two-component system, OmpR family, response regulator